MNRTTIAAALLSFLLGLAAGWLLFSDSATVPQSEFTDLEAAAAAIADENHSLRQEAALREQLNRAQFEEIEALKARIELMPEAL
jgi:hypothetical protein